MPQVVVDPWHMPTELSRHELVHLLPARILHTHQQHHLLPVHPPGVMATAHACKQRNGQSAHMAQRTMPEAVRRAPAQARTTDLTRLIGSDLPWEGRLNRGQLGDEVMLKGSQQHWNHTTLHKTPAGHWLEVVVIDKPFNKKIHLAANYHGWSNAANVRHHFPIIKKEGANPHPGKPRYVCIENGRMTNGFECGLW